MPEAYRRNGTSGGGGQPGSLAAVSWISGWQSLAHWQQLLEGCLEKPAPLSLPSFFRSRLARAVPMLIVGKPLHHPL